MSRVPTVRRWSRAALIAAALAGAPAGALAQLPIPGLSRTYTFFGCNFEHAAVFGPGPRACGTVGITVGPDAVDPLNPPTYWVAEMRVAATFTAPWGWLDCGSTDCGPVRPDVGFGAWTMDAFHVRTCSLGLACAPGATGYGLLPFQVPVGYVPHVVTFGAYVFDPAQVSPGDPVWDPSQSGSMFGGPLPGITAYPVGIALTPVPEPSAVVLLAFGGLALGGIAKSRGRV